MNNREKGEEKEGKGVEIWRPRAYFHAVSVSPFTFPLSISLIVLLDPLFFPF